MRKYWYELKIRIQANYFAAKYMWILRSQFWNLAKENFRSQQRFWPPTEQSMINFTIAVKRLAFKKNNPVLTELADDLLKRYYKDFQES